MKTVREYYKIARASGAFKAVECLALARTAHDMDLNSRISVPPATVAREVMPDGSNPVNLSFGIKVF